MTDRKTGLAPAPCAPDASATSLAALPSHLAQEVLMRLDDHRDVTAAGCVSREWRRLVRDEAVWRTAYCRRFPAWGHERTLRGAAEWRAELSWEQRFRWRLGIDRAWRTGARRLERVYSNHAAWVNAVRLLPGGAGVASGGSEGAVNVWSLEGEPLLHDVTHSQSVWALDAGERTVVSGSMDGWVQVLDLVEGRVAARAAAGWRGPPGNPPDAADWQQFDVVTSVQLLPGGSEVLTGCMDGTIRLLDLRCAQPTALQLVWGPAASDGAAPGGPGLLWHPGGTPRLCAARCHGNLVVAGGDAAALTLHDLRAGGARFAELALPAGAARTAPAVFALDLLYPRLATGGDGGQVQVWDLSRLDAPPGVLPMAADGPPPPRIVYHLPPGGAGDVTPPDTPRAQPAAALGSQQQQQQGPGAGPGGGAPGWPSPGDGWRRGRQAHSGSSPAAASAECLVATNECLLRGGLDMGCVYGIKALEGGAVLTADHAGHVRHWSAAELVGRGRGAAGCLTVLPGFAPSLEHPASALIDPQGGLMRPVAQHCVDACLTHLAVAGRDSVVRLYRIGNLQEEDE